MNDYEKSMEKIESAGKAKNVEKTGKQERNHFKNCCWNEQIMERFIKANLFIVCCITAGLLLIVYLGAFSCEVSWLLEAHGNLPYSSYILCTEYFIVFIATTILIHGLVTGLPWGLFLWSIIIGLFSIPELILVMIMTTQHWGLQSVHGLTELISYLIRLLINCFTLICVIPTGLRWRREAQVLTQLQDLAARLQIQTPTSNLTGLPIDSDICNGLKIDSRRSSKRLDEKYLPSSITATGTVTGTTSTVGLGTIGTVGPVSTITTAYDNNGYHKTEENFSDYMKNHQPLNDHRHFATTMNLYGSKNEFNASMFTLPIQQSQSRSQSPPPLPPLLSQQQQSSSEIECNNGNRTQSLMDLRCTLPGLYNPRYALENSDGKYFNISIDDLKNNLHDSRKHTQISTATTSLKGLSNINDPIYCSIEASPTSATTTSEVGTVTGTGTSGTSTAVLANAQNVLRKNYETREPMPLPSNQYNNGIGFQLQQQQPPKSLKLLRNCVSLENLDGINKIQNELMYNYNQQQQYYLIMLNYLQQQQQFQQINNCSNDDTTDSLNYSNDHELLPPANHHKSQSLSQISLPNGLYGSARLCHQQQQHYQHQHQQEYYNDYYNHLQQQQQQKQQQKHLQHYRRNSQPHPLQYYGGYGYVNYTNPYITANSKLSLGNESDDYRKYRDVAL